jgi:hypothetical protein
MARRRGAARCGRPGLTSLGPRMSGGTTCAGLWVARQFDGAPPVPLPPCRRWTRYEAQCVGGYAVNPVIKLHTLSRRLSVERLSAGFDARHCSSTSASVVTAIQASYQGTRSAGYAPVYNVMKDTGTGTTSRRRSTGFCDRLETSFGRSSARCYDLLRVRTDIDDGWGGVRRFRHRSVYSEREYVEADVRP